jgi:hypothetical protein
VSHGLELTRSPVAGAGNGNSKLGHSRTRYVDRKATQLLSCGYVDDGAKKCFRVDVSVDVRVDVSSACSRSCTPTAQCRLPPPGLIGRPLRQVES